MYRNCSSSGLALHSTERGPLSTRPFCNRWIVELGPRLSGTSGAPVGRCRSFQPLIHDDSLGVPRPRGAWATRGCSPGGYPIRGLFRRHPATLAHLSIGQRRRQVALSLGLRTLCLEEGGFYPGEIFPGLERRLRPQARTYERIDLTDMEPHRFSCVVSSLVASYLGILEPGVADH